MEINKTPGYSLTNDCEQKRFLEEGKINRSNDNNNNNNNHNNNNNNDNNNNIGR